MAGNNMLVCMLLVSAGLVSARQLQQQQQQPLDVGGLVNQIGQVASQGLQNVLDQSGQRTQKAANASRPLAGVGDALQNIGATINRPAGAGAAEPPAKGPGRKPSSPTGVAATPAPDNSLLANTSEITSNITGGIGNILSNLTSGLANVTGQQQQQQKQPEITPPPGIGKSGAGAATVSGLASLAAAAVVLVQLLA